MGTSDKPNVRRHKRGWIALTCLAAVPCAFLLFIIGWYRGYRDWHTAKATPLFSDIVPADGATVYASDAWISWTSPVAAKGRVLWRRTGSSGAKSVDAGSGDQLLAHLASLSSGSKYEYVVEENDGTQTLRSAIRTLKVVSGLSFDPVIDQTVDRDYDQTVKLTLHNHGSQTVRVAARALKQYEDLPSDITGYGSVDVPAEIAPNSTLDLRLAVTAADAARDNYEIPVEAAGAYVNVKFHVRRPKLDLAFHVINDDPNTLAQTVEIHNNGDALTDLSISVIKENEKDLTLAPSTNHLRLNSQASTRVTASPVLFLEFESLKAEIVARAAGQSANFPLAFKAPPGVHLIAFRTDDEQSTSADDFVCTNKPNTCSFARMKGNGPALAASAQSTSIQQPENTHEVLLASLDSERARTLLSSILFQAASSNLEPPKPSAPGPPDPATCNKCQNKCSAEVKDLVKDLDNILSALTAAAAAKDSKYVQALMTQEQDLEKQINATLAECESWCEGRQSAEAACKQGRYDTEQIRQQLEDTARLYENIAQTCDLGKDLIGGGGVFVAAIKKALADALAKGATGAAAAAEEAAEAAAEAQIALYTAGAAVVGGAACSHFFHDMSDEYRNMADNMVPPSCDSLYPKDGLGTGLAASLPKRSSSHVSRVVWRESYPRLHRLYLKEPPNEDFHERVIAQTGYTSERIGAVTPASKVVALRKLEEAYVAAYTTSYRRYLKAQSAKDAEAAVLQATSMVRFAGLAVQATRAQWNALYETESIMVNDFEDVTRELSANGTSWKSKFADAQVEIASRGMPQELRGALLGLGLSDADVDRYQDNIRAATADNVEQAIAREKRRVQRAGQLALSLADGHVGRSDPPDAAVLTRLATYAQTLVDATEKSKQPRTSSGNITNVNLSPSFIEALGRRAGFTRHHKGILASPLDGTSTNSSNLPATVYDNARACFAWHTAYEDVVFACFDQIGNPVVKPHAIGRGRWPRVTADGNRIAVAWIRPDQHGFTVRIDEGDGLSKEIPLPGLGANLVFAPHGSLFAASSEGLFELKSDHFELIKAIHYYQPTISVAADRQPHVTSVRNGHAIYDDTDLGEGEYPSSVVTAGAVTYITYISNGRVVLQNLRNGQWSLPDKIAVNKPSWPALALDNNGQVRLSYIGPAQYGPEATWLITLPSKNPIMLPSLAGNVTDAWLTTNFTLRQPRNYYRRHYLLLSVNDSPSKMFENEVPEGRYLFRLSPNEIFTSMSDANPNRIAIHSWHMNPGHYASNTGYKLTIRTLWSENYVFAADEEEARATIPRQKINQDQPDLGLFANAADLPIDMPKPGKIDIPILVANLGEATSIPTRVLMYRGDGTTTLLGSAQVPALKRDEQKTVNMPLDYDGKMPSVFFRLENNKDFDDSNDELKLVLWEPLPTGYVGPDPTFPKVPLELKLTVDGQPAAQYDVLDAFTNRVIAKVINGEQYGALRTGDYHLAVKPYSSEGQEISFTDDIEHQAGTVQQVDLKSGIKIEPQDLAAKMWRWSAIRTDDPGTTVQWQSGSHSFMALASSEYLIEFQPNGGASGSVLWPQKIQVQPGQQAILNINSGLRLDIPQQLLTNLSHWRVVHAGNPAQIVQELDASNRTIILPPGDYQISTAGVGTEFQWVTWPQKVQVQPGQQATFSINSGMRLDVPPELQPDLTHWRVVNFANPSQVVQQLDANIRTTILPPGDYQVSTTGLGTEFQWVTWPGKIQLQQGQQAAFTINSSMRLELPQEIASRLFHWRLVRFGKAETVQELDANRRTTIVPPGDYQISTAGVGTEYQWVTWPQKIQVQPGQQATFTINSGMRLEMPQEIASRLFHWRVLGLGKPETIQELDANHRTTILPPGDYQVSTTGVGTEYQWVTWPQKIQVQYGKDGTVNLDCGFRLIGPGSEVGYEFSFKDETGRQLENWKGPTVQLVPPGKYSLEARSNLSAAWKKLQNNVVVNPGTITEITVPVLQQSSDQNTGFHH